MSITWWQFSVLLVAILINAGFIFYWLRLKFDEIQFLQDEELTKYRKLLQEKTEKINDLHERIEFLEIDLHKLEARLNEPKTKKKDKSLSIENATND